MKKKLLYIRLSQLFISLIIAFLALFGTINDDGLLLSGFLKYLPSILGIFIVLLAIVELFFTRHIVRLVYLLISIVAVIILMQDGLILLNASIWVLSIVYFVLILISVIRINKSVVKVKKKDTIPFGYCSFKEFVIFISATLISCVPLGIGTYLFIENIFSDIGNQNVGVYFFISTFLLIFTVIIYGFTNKLTKALTAFSKSTDYNRFMLDTNAILQNKINDEYAIYIKLLQVNYSFIVDKENAYKIFESIQTPTRMSNKRLYGLVEILYFINKSEYQKADDLLTKFGLTYGRKSKQFINLKNLIIAFSSDKEIMNIESKYPLKYTKLINLINASTLLEYYKNRNNLNKAKFYASYILNNTTQFTQIIEEAEQVMKM
ncbi:MAG: hypothetical protein J1F31_02975 [Erysipelotrichales bacterium]|nr:hypothetical protein [Erysipelotrichales bacterium]